MNLKPLTTMFMDDQGGLDEIVVVIAVFVAFGLTGQAYATFGQHQIFVLKDFAEGMMKMAAGAGAWQALRGGMRAFTDRR